MDLQNTPNGRLTARALLGNAARVVVVGRHSVPIVRAWAGLIRAEGDLARDSLGSLLVAAGVAAVGVLILFSALVSGVVVGLHAMGWSVWASVAVPTGAGAALALVAGWIAYTRFIRLTFPETRRRLSALLEVLDEP